MALVEFEFLEHKVLFSFVYEKGGLHLMASTAQQNYENNYKNNYY